MFSKIKDKKIEAVKDWLELKLVQGIWTFIGFTNTYCRFIQSFSKMTIIFTLILKIIGLSKVLTLKALRANNNKINEDNSGNKADENSS